MEFGAVTWAGVAVSVVGAGLWGALGAVGGVGAFDRGVESE
jgi:hypothetical protein